MTHPDALVLARAYADGGRWQDSLREVAAVLAADPRDVDALLLASRAHLALEETEQALAAAQAAGRLDPTSPAPAMNAALALSALRRPKEAREAADRAVAIAPNLVTAHLVRIDVETSARSFSREADASGQAALRLAPNDPAVHVALGNLDLARGQAHLARMSYEQALRLDPDNRAAQYNLALAASGRVNGMPDAVRHLRQLLRADPSEGSYELLLRRSLFTVVTTAVALTLMATLFLLPGGGRAAPSGALVGVVLLLCLLLQGGALVWIRRTVGPAALSVLRDRGWRRTLLVVAAVAIAAADVALAVAVGVPPPGRSGLVGGAATLTFLALVAMIPSAANRRR
ncbi:tetratricopeptide repeat protein [Serinibacter arcticus]|uniref:tetratricopeptide repeat protein n=1 Tax=Serinibacter arcticus TaxID=1655435 RepID=UPI00130492E6|nr:tetratricopeptide repeat protein [Serinibacter arcticus]